MNENGGGASPDQGMRWPHNANTSYAIFMAEILERANGSTEAVSLAALAGPMVDPLG
jgi:hypothetical protein